MDQRLIIADKTQGWAHVSIPKCGCQSIRRSLESHLGLTPGHTVNGRKWPCRLSFDELQQSPELFRWSVVRDPRARLVSTWANKTQLMLPDGINGLAECYKPFLGSPFEDFAHWAGKQDVATDSVDIHIRACSWWLIEDGELIVDAAFRLRDLNTVWPSLQSRFGYPKLGHRNSSQHLPWRQYFTPELDALVKSAYADDFTMWFPGEQVT